MNNSMEDKAYGRAKYRGKLTSQRGFVPGYFGQAALMVMGDILIDMDIGDVYLNNTMPMDPNKVFSSPYELIIGELEDISEVSSEDYEKLRLAHATFVDKLIEHIQISEKHTSGDYYESGYGDILKIIFTDKDAKIIKKIGSPAELEPKIIEPVNIFSGFSCSDAGVSSFRISVDSYRIAMQLLENVLEIDHRLVSAYHTRDQNIRVYDCDFNPDKFVPPPKDLFDTSGYNPSFEIPIENKIGRYGDKTWRIINHGCSKGSTATPGLTLIESTNGSWNGLSLIVNTGISGKTEKIWESVSAKLEDYYQLEAHYLNCKYIYENGKLVSTDEQLNIK